MSTKMKQRRARAKVKARAVTARHRGEDLAFFERGTIPKTATAFAKCSCGSMAYARGGGDLGDWNDVHAYCDDYV